MWEGGEGDAKYNVWLAGIVLETMGIGYLLTYWNAELRFAFRDVSCGNMVEPPKRGSWRPSWGKNVLRGLSNKCLMRGTFPAISQNRAFSRFFVILPILAVSSLPGKSKK